jgi:hypothetical protein
MPKTKKMFVGLTEETFQNGTAGCQVAYIDGKEWRKGCLILTVYVFDMDGELAGPYKIDNEWLEVRES